MRSVLLFVFAIIFATTAATEVDEWIKFKHEHRKSYLSDLEEIRRFSIFQENIQKIQEHNKNFENGKTSYTMALNEFADLTSAEFLEKMTIPRSLKPVLPLTKGVSYKDVADDLPDSIDWTKKGAVTKVVDQSDCFASLSFNTVGTVESQYFIKTGTLIPLSERNLEDCTTRQDGLEYIKKNGIMTVEDYPCAQPDNTCKFNSSAFLVHISSYVQVKENDELELQKAIATIGPVSVGIEVSNEFQFYVAGVLNDTTCGSNVNHGVLVTGYDTVDGQDYWMVKNSWGPNWGDKGYIWMSRNADNQCGIASEAFYPVI